MDNPLIRAVEWLLDLVRTIPIVEMLTAEVTADGIAVQGEDAAPMARIAPAPVGAVGAVLAVGPVRLWLGPYNPDPPTDHTATLAALTADTGWHDLALQADWTAVAPCQYRVRGGLVTLRGVAAYTGGIGPSYRVIAMLPTAARPAVDTPPFPSITRAAADPGIVSVTSAGEVRAASATSERVSLAGVTYWAGA